MEFRYDENFGIPGPEDEFWQPVAPYDQRWNKRAFWPGSDIYGTLVGQDLFVPIDGEDWFDFQLTPDFMQNLYTAYSEPERLTPDEMAADSPALKIRISPKLAFKLFEILELNKLHKSIHQEQEINATTDTSLESESLNHQSIERNSDPSVEQHISDIETLVREEAKVIMKLHEIRNRRDQIQKEMSLKLTVAKLKAVFPTQPPAALEDVFDNNGREFEETVNSLRGCGLNPKELDDDSEFDGSAEIIADVVKQESAELTELKVLVKESDDEANLTAEQWRKMARTHHALANQYVMRGQLVAKQGLTGGLAYFTKMANLHRHQKHEADLKATLIITGEGRSGNKNILDLHHLHVPEAIDELHNHLAECVKTMECKGMKEMCIRVITGNMENEIPRIEPAVIEYLQEHNYLFRPTDGSVIVTLKKTEGRFQR